MNTIKNPKPIAIFKPGTHTAMSGLTMDFSEEKLQATVAAYNPTLHNAPLVIGHPKDNTPAYGWTAGLEYADGLIKAKTDAVTQEFADWVDKGFYKKVSASFYAPDNPNNPVPGVYYLRHIGFLGGQPPAVKGLPEPQFADEGDFITIEFSENPPKMDENAKKLAEEKAELEKQRQALAKQQADFAEQNNKLNAEIVALAKEKAAATKKEVESFAEGLVKDGKLLPKDKQGLVEFMSGIGQAQVLEFGEGDAKTTVPATAWFKQFMQGQPKAIEFSEVTGRPTQPGKQLTDEQIAAKARAYKADMEKQGTVVSYSQAVDAVTIDNALGV